MLAVDLQLVESVISAPEIPVPVYVRNILLDVSSDLLSHGRSPPSGPSPATLYSRESNPGGL
jgi:hypothetical protein